MEDFKKRSNKSFGSRGGGFDRRNTGRGRSGGGRGRSPVTMYQAVCDQCKKPCEVPFKPTSGKPVYCSFCFEGKKEVGNNRGGDRFSQRSRDRYEAPVRSDFGSDIGKGNNNEAKKQLEILNGKMDLLIRAVESLADTKPSVAIKKTEKVVKRAPKTAKKVPVVKA
jgi:CxxC-x17-CxxC domain-containing protein